MKKILTVSTIAFLAGPALALGDQQHNDHSTHEMHDDADHTGRDHKAGKPAAPNTSDNAAVITKTDEILAALEAGGEPIVVDILGVVCDFCAKAMNKTFGKREEVAATYVDLDTKAMSLVLVPGTVLDDETIDKLVEKAGYRASAIRRGEIALNGGGDASDHS